MLVVRKEHKMAWLQYTVHLQLSIYQSSWLHYGGLHISLSHYIFIQLWFISHHVMPKLYSTE